MLLSVCGMKDFEGACLRVMAEYNFIASKQAGMHILA